MIEKRPDNRRALIHKGNIMAQRNQKRDPNKTKTGKTRLGGLTVPQLTTLLEREGKRKVKAKILNRIRIVTSRRGYVAPVEKVSDAVTE
jgi:hypothetical protein